MKKLIVMAVAAASLAFGCTSIKVEPILREENLTKVCVIENKRVKVYDMLPVLVGGFERHNIITEVHETPADTCAYNLTYTALQTWDVVPYMSYAEVAIDAKDGRKVGSGVYYLKGKGGFSLMKWQDTKTKLDPLIEQLLQNY